MDTFVVRVWGPMADEEKAMSLRGVVEHPASGWQERFRNVEELVSILRTPGPRAEGAGQAMGET